MWTILLILYLTMVVVIGLIVLIAHTPRLMDNPRLKIPHVRAILANSSMTATVLLAIKRHSDWMNDDEIRYSFCNHPRTPFTALEDVLPTLPRHRLVALTRNGNLHPRVREKAKALVGRGSGGG